MPSMRSLSCPLSTSDANDVADKVEAYLRYPYLDSREDNDIANEREHSLWSLNINLFRVTDALSSLAGRLESENQGSGARLEVYAGGIFPAEQMPKDKKGGLKRKREEEDGGGG